MGTSEGNEAELAKCKEGCLLPVLLLQFPWLLNFSELCELVVIYLVFYVYLRVLCILLDRVFCIC